MTISECRVAASKWNFDATSQVVKDAPEKSASRRSPNMIANVLHKEPSIEAIGSGFHGSHQAMASIDLEAKAPMLSLLEQTPLRASYLYACSPGDYTTNISPLKRMMAEDLLHQVCGGPSLRILSSAHGKDALKRVPRTLDMKECVQDYQVQDEHYAGGEIFEMEL